MLDVKRLRILREVAQRGSFSAAAEALYLSQSAVSQQIATLEREVGMKLLDRTREGPKLTDAGRVLVGHAEAAIARLEEAERELAARQVVPLAELADEEWLCGSRSSSCGEVIFRACRDAGFEPQVGFESDDYHVMQGFIAAGLGFTLLPDLALPTLRSDLVIRATDPPAPQRRGWAATRAEGSRSPATEEMVAILVEVGEAFALRSRERLSLVA